MDSEEGILCKFKECHILSTGSDRLREAEARTRTRRAWVMNGGTAHNHLSSERTLIDSDFR